MTAHAIRAFFQRLAFLGIGRMPLRHRRDKGFVGKESLIGAALKLIAAFGKDRHAFGRSPAARIVRIKRVIGLHILLQPKGMHLQPAIAAIAVGFEAFLDKLPDLLGLRGLQISDKIIKLRAFIDINLLFGLRNVA